SCGGPDSHAAGSRSGSAQIPLRRARISGGGLGVCTSALSWARDLCGGREAPVGLARRAAPTMGDGGAGGHPLSGGALGFCIGVLAVFSDLGSGGSLRTGSKRELTTVSDDRNAVAGIARGGGDRQRLGHCVGGTAATTAFRSSRGMPRPGALAARTTSPSSCGTAIRQPAIAACGA